MSIDSDAQQDLALSEEDAGNVAGGRSTPKRKAPAKHATPAVTSIVVGGSPLSGDAGVPAGQSQAELESDPDC